MTKFTDGLVVRKSKISGRGFFAARDFKKGEMVMKWHPKFLIGSQVTKLPKAKKHFVDQIGKEQFVLQRPAQRFMNHSCDPNTRVRDLSDVAIRNIKKGEEVTSDYGKVLIPFECRCGSKKCRGIIGQKTRRSK